jgi:hypothetical protein
MGVGDGGVTSASARVRRMPVRCLAPQTWSVPDFVRTDLRTVRLAIACSDRSHRAAPSQVADGHPNSPLGGGNEQAWKEHHMISCSPNAHAEWERKDTHIAPVLPECARGKRKDEGCWPLVLAQRARMVKLIVTLWAVLVEARSKRPISLVA